MKRKLKKLYELHPFKTEVNLNKHNASSNIKNTEISSQANQKTNTKIKSKDHKKNRLHFLVIFLLFYTIKIYNV